MMISNWFLYRILDRKVAEPISRISRIISKGDPRQIVSAVEGSSSPVFEVNLLEEKAVEMAKRIMEYQADLKRRERDKATGELARQIAHDIRSPLGALKILNSQLSTNAAQAELMKDVISRVEGMAENLLDKSRKLPEPISATSICESLDRLSKTFEIKCLERSVQLQTNFTMINMISQVYANMGQFERIVNNLLENALDASFSNSMISVSALLEGQFFIVNVEDQGKGLPAEIEEALGAGTARSTKPGGNGLGLLSVYQTVKDWSGEVTYAKLNPGSRFSIKLPLF
jgi:signal transduction histidine kinase